MEQINIEKAAVEDCAALQSIGRQTFAETFAGSNTAADMKKYLDENFSDEKVGVELRYPGSVFFIAKDGERVVGYMKLNTGKAQTELQDEASLEIERIYVLREYHGKKLGQLLLDKALEEAQYQGKSYVWLGVWEENDRAIGFYTKNGFAAFDKHVFKLGEDVQIDIMMKKML